MKTIIITGANGNLGSATVKKFLDEGHAVIAVDSKNDHLGFAAGNAHFEFQAVNLTQEADSAAFIKSVIAKHGQVDAALLLVGGFAMGNITTTNGEAIRQQLSLNFETAYFLARPLIGHMQETGHGRIVFIGARPAINPRQGKNTLAYALSKSLLFRLAEFINEENKGSDITASVVVPSTIDTAINRESMPNANPADWVKPEQLAEILEFIVSDKGLPLRETLFKVYNNA